MSFKQTTEMYVEVNDQVINPCVRALSSEAHHIIKSCGATGSPRSWARDGLQITHVHEVTSFSKDDEGMEADSILVVTFEDGSSDFFCAENDTGYNWTGIGHGQVVEPDSIKKKPYQEVADFTIIEEFTTIYNEEIKTL